MFDEGRKARVIDAYITAVNEPMPIEKTRGMYTTSPEVRTTLSLHLFC